MKPWIIIWDIERRRRERERGEEHKRSLRLPLPLPARDPRAEIDPAEDRELPLDRKGMAPHRGC
jgi:hypothetical protein